MDSLVEPRVVQQAVAIVKAKFFNHQEPDRLLGQVVDRWEFHTDRVAAPLHQVVHHQASGHSDQELVLEHHPQSALIPLARGHLQGLNLVAPERFGELVQIQDGEERDPEPEADLANDKSASEDDGGLGVGGQNVGPEPLTVKVQSAKEGADKHRVEENVANGEWAWVVVDGGAPFVLDLVGVLMLKRRGL